MDIGIKINYLSSKVAGNKEKRELFFFEWGTIVSVHPNFRIGIHLHNPFGISDHEMLPVPEIYTAGFSWQWDDLFLFTGKAERKDGKHLFSGGLEYTYLGYLKIACGFNSSGNGFYSGIRILPGALEIAVQYQSDHIVGNITGIAIGWSKK